MDYIVSVKQNCELSLKEKLIKYYLYMKMLSWVLFYVFFFCFFISPAKLSFICIAL